MKLKKYTMSEAALAARRKGGQATSRKLKKSGREKRALSGGTALITKYGKDYYRAIRVHGWNKKRKRKTRVT